MLYDSFISPFLQYLNLELFWVVLAATVVNYLLVCFFFERRVFDLGNIVKMLSASVYVFLFLSVFPDIAAECSVGVSTLIFALFLFGPIAIYFLRAVLNHDPILFVR